MASDQPKTPLVTNPTVDVGDELAWLVGETGGIEHQMGGYKIKIFHSRAFPWDEVFKALLFRDFRVYVTRHKADLYIEAQP
jgi:hypothetical protein